jgi:hypothetical protein
MVDTEHILRSLAKTTMSALSRAFFLCLAVASALDAACAGDGGVSLGGFMCARPFSPACADQPATYQRPEKVSACQREIDGFVVATAAYRDCLQRQIADAVRQANDVLDRFHCLSRGDSCPSPAKHP